MHLRHFPADRLHARSSGTGPTVLCLHSSGASGQQWLPLATALPDWRVVRVDAHGHGASPAPDEAMPVFEQDAHWLLPFVLGPHDGVHLVGHSYGAALAVRIALACPDRVRSLTLYEPVLFGLLGAPGIAPALREEVLQVGRSIALWVRQRQARRAARLFVDYWSGSGAWRRLGSRQQHTVMTRMPVIAGHFASLQQAAITVRDLDRLHVPTLLLGGARSPRPARALMDLLAVHWPHADARRFATLGHLGPVVAPATVNPAIAGFLARHEPAPGEGPAQASKPAALCEPSQNGLVLLRPQRHSQHWLPAT